MIVLTYNSKTDYTIGNYLFDAIKRRQEPVMFIPKSKIWKDLRERFDILIKIDDGEFDHTDYRYILGDWGTKLVYWCVDSHTDYNRCLSIAHGFDITFCAQKNGTEKLRKDGINAFWLPCACDPIYHTSIYDNLSQRPFDIGFAGSTTSSWNPGRARFIDTIRNNFSDKKLYLGPGSKGQCSIINGSSKIIVNQNCNNDINMRVFEAISSGAILITEKVKDNGFEELGLEDKCFQYETGEELLAITKRVTEDGLSMYNNITRKCVDFMQSKHTYEHRYIEMMRIINDH